MLKLFRGTNYCLQLILEITYHCGNKTDSCVLGMKTLCVRTGRNSRGFQVKQKSRLVHSVNECILSIDDLLSAVCLRSAVKTACSAASPLAEEWDGTTWAPGVARLCVLPALQQLRTILFSSQLR